MIQNTLVEKNGYQSLKSDWISNPVNKTSIHCSDVNYGPKVKTELSDFKWGLVTIWRFQGPVNIMLK